MKTRHLILIITIIFLPLVILAFTPHRSKNGSGFFKLNDLLKRDSTNNYKRYRDEKQGKLWVGLQFGVNVINNKLIVAYYTDGSTATLSKNGVFEYGCLVGYTTKFNLDFSVCVYSYRSRLVVNDQADLKYVNAKFNRWLLNPIIKYIIETRNERHNFNFGVGLLLTNQPLLDIDASNMPDGAHNQYYYKNAVGTTFHFEWQFGIDEDNTVLFKLYCKYTLLTYKLKTAMLDGINWPIDQLPSDIEAEMGKINSDGIEIGIGFIVPVFKH